MGNLINSILSGVTDAPILNEGYYIDPGALGNFAKIIIEGVGIIGVGIIVFALVLKAITLPFDIYQRVKMRKQTLLMREMQPELEKLQKQYANDKGMYNQKMMELYKKNGYSMFSACLPMIVSLVILIIAFSGFRSYSTSANLAMYEKMSHAYNQAIAEYTVEGKDFYLNEENKLYEMVGEDIRIVADWETDASFAENGVSYTMKTISETKYLTVQSADENDNKCIFYQYPLLNGTKGNREYKIDKDKLFLNAEEKAQIDAMVQNETSPVSEDEACRLYYARPGAAAAKAWYEDGHDASFLWVKNVWYPDVSYDHPIQSYKSFSKQFDSNTVKFKEDGRKDKLANVLDDKKYSYLTMEMSDYTKKPNGYFILILLSVGLMVGSQLISMRSQKESSKYQTVDGSGARTQKIMLVVMPIIYGIFAFMYSAAFSIYMVMSSFISICVTLISNLIIGHIFRKKEVAQIQEKNSRIPAWMKQQNEYKNGKKDKDRPKGNRKK